MTNQKTQAVLRFNGAHWTVRVRNAGESTWCPVLDTKSVSPTYDDHGFEVSRKHKVRTFATEQAARDYLTESLPGIEVVNSIAEEVPRGLRGLFLKMFANHAARPQPDVRE